jgi:hypothetical protein
MVVTLLGISAACLSSIADSVRRLREKRSDMQWRSDLSTLDQWCCNDFPIVRDMTQWLVNRDLTIERFREEMRKKYLREP